MDGTKNNLLEIWLDVPGFEGRYQVSNLGNVRSVQREVCGFLGCRIIPDRTMKLHTHNNGYQVVWLRKPGKHIKFFVHRLVAYAFLPKAEEHTEVNHKNKIRTDNTVENLEWMTHIENCEHRDNSDVPF